MKDEYFEIIIADSVDSNDKTSLLGHPFTYINTGLKSRAKQMNAGAKAATGDILVFLHADVIPPQSFISDIKRVIKNGVYFGFFAYRFEPSSFMLNINASFTGRKGVFAGGGDQIHFMTKTLFEELGGYNELYEIMEDFELFRRIKKTKKPYEIIQNKAIVSSRKYDNNSWIRVNIANLIAFMMFLMKAESKRIKSLYYSLLK